MTIPIYKASEVNRGHENLLIGDDPVLQFEGFISSMIKANVFDDATQSGIFKLTLDEGTDHLSSKQFYVLKKKLQEYDKLCKVIDCQKELSWSEVDVYNDDSYCSDCSYTQSRIQDGLKKDR